MTWLRENELVIYVVGYHLFAGHVVASVGTAGYDGA